MRKFLALLLALLMVLPLAASCTADEPPAPEQPETPADPVVEELQIFADKLEKACFKTLADGYMTKDLTLLAEDGFEVRSVNSGEFLDIIADNLIKTL